ncbi:MAG: methyltransferase [Candidatus Kapabacteria bacterium]|nr:methyltransferase [Candidatus Kapabacteria bacterium]
MRLLHGDGSDAYGASPLEPLYHAEIYSTIEKLLDGLTPMVSGAVNHVILRGTYEEFAVIINVRGLDARVVRSLRTLAERVQKAHPSVMHAWIYHDPKGSRYYLDLERPATGVGAKKLYGASAWMQTIGDVTYQVGVFSFTQVNLAMTQLLIDTVKAHAGVTIDDTLYDIYCGYGLFSAALAKDVQRVIAIDGEEATVDNARYTIRRAGGQVTAIRQVLRNGEDMRTVVNTIQKMSRKDPAASSNVVILDPPRSGTAEGMIAETATGLDPRVVVEVFCGSEEIHRSTREWKQAGYGLQRITPLDLFPGTMGMEFVITYAKGFISDAPEPNQTLRRSVSRWQR